MLEVRGIDPRFSGEVVVQLDREPTHPAFAYGRHRCLGAHIARKELAIMIEEFLAAIPAFRIEPSDKVT